MANWFYFDNDGTKQGPINDYQLKALVRRGVITTETHIETASGQQVTAEKIKGLPFPTASMPPSNSNETYGVSENFTTTATGFPPVESGDIPPVLPPFSDAFTASEMPVQPPISTAKSKTKPSQTIEDTLTNFKAKPGLNWLLDLKFNLCYVFTFAKSIIQILYVICLVLTVLAILVGPIVNSYGIWQPYSRGRGRIAELYKTERELKSQVREIGKLSDEKLREQAEAAVREEYAGYTFVLQNELDKLKKKSVQEIRESLTAALKSKLSNIGSEIQTTKQHIPSFTATAAWMILITLATWIVALLEIFFIRLLCEWWIFMLGWLVDTRQASQRIIAESTLET